MTFPQIGLVTIRAADLRRTVGFYEALGLRFVEERHGSGPVHHAAVCGGCVFEIYPLREGDAPTRSTRLGWTVADVATATRDALAAGGTLRVPPTPTQSGIRSVVVDPEGHTVELFGEDTPRPSEQG